ncbi:MAG: hypothetical protein HYX51_01735 [Chloroflexi bacterium]|nr:hypothetical protein [Chloroflexota bacterium]
MRAIVVAVLALCAIAWALPASASTTQETLRLATLDQADFGRDYTLIQEGTVPELDEIGIPSYMVGYARVPSIVNPSFEVVVNLLAEMSADEAVDRAGFVRNIEQALAGQAGFRSERIDAPAIGDDSWRYKVSGELAGQTVAGELVLWRHGSVIAAIFALGPNGADASGYAVKQEAKLTATLGQ